MTKVKLKYWVTDIRFWLIFYLIIRLVGITNPPLETGHNWRQSFTCMVARNFYESEPNLLYPRVDFAGDKSGIIGSEFPVFNYLIYVISEVFGYDHWYGRLINLIISTLGIWYFYRLIRELMGKPVAFYASMVLTVSIWFSFSRKIMPDTFSVAILLIGLYYGYRYLINGKFIELFLFFICSTLGVLAKIPAFSLFALSGLALVIPEVDKKRGIIFSSVSGLSCLLVAVWYFYWVPHLHHTYGIILYDSRGIAEGFLEVVANWKGFLEKFYFSALHSYLALACCLLGFVLFFKTKPTFWKLGIAVVTMIFTFFIVKTGGIFPTHNYYVIPFVPVMALMAGYALAMLPPKFQYVVLLLISIEGIANQQHDFFIKESEKYKLTLDDSLSDYVDPNNLIIINGGPSPQDIYFAHKKGWSVTNGELAEEGLLDSLSHQGANYLVIDKTKEGAPDILRNLIYEDEHYKFYVLRP